MRVLPSLSLVSLRRPWPSCFNLAVSARGKACDFNHRSVCVALAAVLMGGLVCQRIGAQTGPQLTILLPSGGTPEGGAPVHAERTPVIQASDGNYYVGTVIGSNPGILEITPAGVVSTFYTFPTSPTTYRDITSLIQGNDGNLYATVLNFNPTSPLGLDALFKVTLAGVGSIVHTFGGALYSSGTGVRSLIEGSDGNFYGVFSGYQYSTNAPYGPIDYGEVFSLTPGGTFTTLYAFANGTDGTMPTSLVEGSPGTLYGMTHYGGAQSDQNGFGTLFTIANGKYSTLYDFQGSQDGGWPVQIIPAPDGSLFGMTSGGQLGTATQDFSLGTFFHFSNGSLNTLFTFTSAKDTSVGVFPSSLMLASDGNYYATVSAGNPGGWGTLDSFSPTGVQTTLYNFLNGSDGYDPQQTLLQGSDGSLYGSTQFYGSIYKLQTTPALNPAVQISFGATSANPGQTVTINWSVANATSATLQQCVASSMGPAPDPNWTGLQKGTVNGNTFTGSATITPTADGTYTYGLTCGGIESGFATLNVGTGAATTTTLTVSSATITAGQAETLKATVTDANGPVTAGSVTFTDNGQTLGAAVAVNAQGVATLTTTTLPTSANSIIASYAATFTEAASTSAAVTVTVTAAPAITFSQPSLTFPSQLDGTISASMPLVITNSGGTILSLGTISIIGPNGGDFTQTNNCPTGNFAVGATCTVEVDYAPSAGASGAESASLQIADTAPANPQHIALIGTAQLPPTSPVASVTPSTLVFGTITAGVVSGTTSAAQTVTVKNTGNAPLIFPTPGATLSGPNQGDFSATSGCDGQTVAANANCSIGVTFHPAASVGVESATLQIMDNATGSPQLVTLSGFAVPPPSISCTPPSINISAQGTSNYPIPCTSTAYTGTVTFVCNLPASLATFVSCSFSPTTVSFASSSTGSTTLTLTIPPASAALHSPRLPGYLGAGGIVFALAFWPFWLPVSSRSRKRSSMLLALPFAAIFALLALNGCGGSGNSGLPPAGSYQGTIAVTGTGLNASIPFTITVK